MSVTGLFSQYHKNMLLIPVFFLNNLKNNISGFLLKVMLVSLCAGGVGLNLIGGNHLFLIDMHW